MKKILAVLFILLLLPNLANAKWYKINSTDAGDFYLDLNRIRTDGDYIYYWELLDMFKPVKGLEGYFSLLRYNQGDCSIIRYKTLQYIFYAQSMGKGEGETQDPTNKEWKYFRPGAVGEQILEKACEQN